MFWGSVRCMRCSSIPKMACRQDVREALKRLKAGNQRQIDLQTSGKGVTSVRWTMQLMMIFWSTVCELVRFPDPLLGEEISAWTCISSALDPDVLMQLCGTIKQWSTHHQNSFSVAGFMLFTNRPSLCGRCTCLYLVCAFHICSLTRYV